MATDAMFARAASASSGISINPAYAWLYSSEQFGFLKNCILLDDVITTPSTPHVPPNSPIEGTQLNLRRREHVKGGGQRRVSASTNNTNALAGRTNWRTLAWEKRRAGWNDMRLRDEIAAWELWRARVLASRAPDPPFLFPLRPLPPFGYASGSAISLENTPSDCPDLASRSQVLSYTTLYSQSCDSASWNHGSHASSVDKFHASPSAAGLPYCTPSRPSRLFTTPATAPAPLSSPAPQSRTPLPSMRRPLSPPGTVGGSYRRWSSEAMAATQAVQSTHIPPGLTETSIVGDSHLPTLHESMASEEWDSQRVVLGKYVEDQTSTMLHDANSISPYHKASRSHNKSNGHHAIGGISQESIGLKEQERHSVACNRHNTQSRSKERTQEFLNWGQHKEKGIPNKIMEILSNTVNTPRSIGRDTCAKRLEKAPEMLNARESVYDRPQVIMNKKSPQIHGNLDNLRTTQTGPLDDPMTGTKASISNVSQVQGDEAKEKDTLSFKTNPFFVVNDLHNIVDCRNPPSSITSKIWSSRFIAPDNKSEVDMFTNNTQDIMKCDMQSEVTENNETQEEKYEVSVDKFPIDPEISKLKSIIPFHETALTVNGSKDTNVFNDDIEKCALSERNFIAYQEYNMANTGDIPAHVNNMSSKTLKKIPSIHGPNILNDVKENHFNKQNNIKNHMIRKTNFKKTTERIRNVTVNQSSSILNGKILKSETAEIFPVRDSLKTRLKILQGTIYPSPIEDIQLDTYGDIPPTDVLKNQIHVNNYINPQATELVFWKINPGDQSEGRKQTEAIVKEGYVGFDYNRSVKPQNEVFNNRSSIDSSHGNENLQNTSTIIQTNHVIERTNLAPMSSVVLERELEVHEYPPLPFSNGRFSNNWCLPRNEHEQHALVHPSENFADPLLNTSVTSLNTYVPLNLSSSLASYASQTLYTTSQMNENIGDNADKKDSTTDNTSHLIQSPYMSVQSASDSAAASASYAMHSPFMYDDSNTLHSMSLNSPGFSYDYWSPTVQTDGVCHQSYFNVEQSDTLCSQNERAFTRESEERDMNLNVSDLHFSPCHGRDYYGLSSPGANSQDSIVQLSVNIVKSDTTESTSYSLTDTLSRIMTSEKESEIENTNRTDPLTNCLSESTHDNMHVSSLSNSLSQSHAEFSSMQRYMPPFVQSSSGNLSDLYTQTTSCNSSDSICNVVHQNPEAASVPNTSDQTYNIHTLNEQQLEVQVHPDRNSQTHGMNQRSLQHCIDRYTRVNAEITKNITKNTNVRRNSSIYNGDPPKIKKTMHFKTNILHQNKKKNLDMYQVNNATTQGLKEQKMHSVNSSQPIHKPVPSDRKTSIKSDPYVNFAIVKTKSEKERKIKSASNHSKYSNKIATGMRVPRKSWIMTTNDHSHTTARSKFHSYPNNENGLMAQGDGVDVVVSPNSATKKRKHASPGTSKKLPRPFSTEDNLFSPKKLRLECATMPLRPVTCPERVRKGLARGKRRPANNTKDVGTSPRTPPPTPSGERKVPKGGEGAASATLSRAKGSSSRGAGKPSPRKRCNRSFSRNTTRSARGSTASGKGKSRGKRIAGTKIEKEDDCTSTPLASWVEELASDTSEWSLLDSAEPTIGELKLTWSNWDVLHDAPTQMNELQQYRHATRKAWRLMAHGEPPAKPLCSQGSVTSRSKKTNLSMKDNNSNSSSSCMEYLKKRLEQEEARLLLVTQGRRSTNASTNTNTNALPGSATTLAPSFPTGRSAPFSFAGNPQWLAAPRGRRPK